MKKKILMIASAVVSVAFVCGACSISVDGSMKRGSESAMTTYSLTYTPSLRREIRFPKVRAEAIASASLH